MINKNGYSLVEVMVSSVILAIVLPVVYQFFITITQVSLNDLTETELKAQSQIIIRNLKKDIKESRAVFNHDDNHASLLLPPECSFGSKLTVNDNSAKNALSIMKHTGKFAYEGKVLNKYKVITYCTVFSGTGSKKMHSLFRGESKETFVDPAPLDLNEQDYIKAEGFSLWLPQEAGVKPVLHENIGYLRRTLTGFLAPEGLLFSQKGNSIRIKLILAKPLKGNRLKTSVSEEEFHSVNFQL